MTYTAPIGSLIAEFLGLKNDVIKNMSPESYVFLWKDDKGNGIALGGDDTVMSRYDPVVKVNLSPSHPHDLIEAFRHHVDKNMSVEECLRIVNQLLREILEPKDDTGESKPISAVGSAA